MRLDVGPGVGERFLAGDSVNTASRIQSVAPEMGVGVGEGPGGRQNIASTTWSCPGRSQGQGRAGPDLPRTAPRASLGVDVTRGTSGPFVGRGAELATLVDLLDATVKRRSLGSRRSSASPD